MGNCHDEPTKATSIALTLWDNDYRPRTNGSLKFLADALDWCGRQVYGEVRDEDQDSDTWQETILNHPELKYLCHILWMGKVKDKRKKYNPLKDKENWYAGTSAARLGRKTKAKCVS